jgi:hypothetical protein
MGARHAAAAAAACALLVAACALVGTQQQRPGSLASSGALDRWVARAEAGAAPLINEQLEKAKALVARAEAGAQVLPVGGADAAKAGANARLAAKASTASPAAATDARLAWPRVQGVREAATAKVGAHARLAAKADTVGPGAAASAGTEDLHVREAAQERMLQMSAMMKQDDESTAAMSGAVHEEARYNVLSFPAAPSPAPARARDSSPRQAAQDAADEFARYSAVAGAGADAYSADKDFFKVERHRSREHARTEAKSVPALSQASDLLARYGVLASAGVSAYHSDSTAMKSRANEETAQEAAKRQAHAPVPVGAALHVLAPSQHWRAARVVDKEGGQVLVHYEGYKHKYDEWIPEESKRIRGLKAAALQARQAEAEKKVAREFSHYAQVAESGQNAYTHDAASAAAGTKWDNHRQYVKDEMRGIRQAQEISARYSSIARLGTPEQTAHAGDDVALAPPREVAVSSAARVQNSHTTTPAKVATSVKTPKFSVVQAAARAAESAAASVVAEAKEAVEEVAGAQGKQKLVHTERPPEQRRAKSGGALHGRGRGRLGDSTERTYAEVGHMLSLAETTAKAEGNAAVRKQVEQEQHTLAKLRNVPGKLPVRVQHNLVSAGASLLRRLGIGAGASAIPQARPLTADSSNAVLAETSASEGSAVVKRKAMLHLHRLHALAHNHGRALRQRLAEGQPVVQAEPVAEVAEAQPVAQADGAQAAAEAQPAASQEDEYGIAVADAGAAEEPAEEHQKEAEETNTDAPQDSIAESRQARVAQENADEEEHAEHEGNTDTRAGEAESADEKPAEVQPSVQVEAPLAAAEVADEKREWQTRKIDEPGDGGQQRSTASADKGADEDGCFVPEFPQVREPLCTPSMVKDGTCKQVWGDVPEIIGAIEAFALKSVHVPGDASKLNFDVVIAPFTHLPDESFGSISVGYQKRADGATWEDKSRVVASSSVWSAVGLMEYAPDMIVKDCRERFLGVISMDPLDDSGHDTEEMSATSGMITPSSKMEQPVRAKIIGEAGKESMSVVKGSLDVLGDDEGLVRYHVYTTDTRRIVAVLQRRDRDSDGIDWVIRMEKDGPLDARVAGILAAQIQAEGMHKVTNMKMVVLAVALILLGLLLLCCLAPIFVRWCSRRGSKKQAAVHKHVEEMELPHSAGIIPHGNSVTGLLPTAASSKGAPPPSSSGWTALSPRSLASSFAPADTVATDRPRSVAWNQDAESVLSTGRGEPAGRGEPNRGDFWDRLPAFEEPTPRLESSEYYQAPLARTQQTPSMAPMMQAARLSSSYAPSAAARGTDKDADTEQNVRSMLAQTGGTSRPKVTPRGWEAKSFRETQRHYRDPADLEIRDVLHNVLDPAQPGGKPPFLWGGRCGCVQDWSGAGAL